MKQVVVIVGVLTIAGGCAAQGTSIDQKLSDIIRGSDATRVAVAYRDLGSSGRSLTINGDQIFHAASTMKVPVMMAIYEAVERGELRMDQEVPVVDEFVSIYDGSTFSIGVDGDSDREIYDHLGRTLTLENLIRRMIVRSSNLATNILIQFVGAERVTELIREAGASRMEVLRGVQDIRAYEAGMSNTATAADLRAVLSRIAIAAMDDPDGAAAAMARILADQEFNEGIPAGLPPRTRVAHKTGSITEIYHDAGIVYPGDREPYVLVVLTAGTDDASAAETVSRISRAIWEEHTR